MRHTLQGSVVYRRALFFCSGHLTNPVSRALLLLVRCLRTFAVPHRSKRPRAAKKHRLAGRVILIVQRQWIVGKALAAAFESEGARPIMANSEHNGLSLVDTPYLAAAVLDGGSRDIGAKLKQRGIPFVFYTGRTAISEESAGAPIVRKPATSHEVVSTVRRLLSK